MVKAKSRYIIISPVRNEERNIEQTIRSVISQTIKPVKWIIVDDGSLDSTPEIVQRYMQDYSWIELLRLKDRGYYDLMNAGEIKAFYRGYEKIKNDNYEFLVKLDGDISFDRSYFDDLFKEFQRDPSLGIASGASYYNCAGKLILEYSYKYHARGAARVYRRQCWEEIGGTMDKLGWDAIDVYKARMLGWNTYNFKDIKMIHHVKTWTKGGILNGRMRSGRMYYLIGVHPIFFLLRVIKCVFAPPYFIGSLTMIFGYVRALYQKEERIVNNELKSYIRREQVCRMLSVIR